MPSLPQPTTPDLEALVALFYEAPGELGRFTEVSADEMPAAYRRLLAHEEHMTVTVEAFHGCLVDVEVLQKKVTARHYARKILLRRQRDRRVVQYGIMRVHLGYLDPEVRDEILGEQIPLGRVLIEHNVLRRVRLSHLWLVSPGPELSRLFGLCEPTTTYGRTAMIECNHEPAVELVEIVTPVLE